MPTDDTNTQGGSAEGSGAGDAKGKRKAAPKGAKAKAAKPKTAKPKAAAAKAKAPTRPSELNRAAERLKQVSDATRLRVLLALAEQPRNVTQLREELGGISQPALSHHLALLRHGRLIEPSRQGKTNVYDLTSGGKELADVVSKLMP